MKLQASQQSNLPFQVLATLNLLKKDSNTEAF